jgi:hypothetical protein
LAQELYKELRDISLKITLKAPTGQFVGIFALRCPHCGNNGTFQNIHNITDIYEQVSRSYLGVRKCPEPNCLGHIFFIKQTDDKILTFPSLRIDFNSDGIPPHIVNCFEEAITCHANKCYTASAIMIRKTLEVICKDRGAEGRTLHDRVTQLRNVVILPNELFDAINDLRLLGNDAAHIESKQFEQISEDEVSISLLLTKEILKALYQYKSLLDDLRKYKKT